MAAFPRGLTSSTRCCCNVTESLIWLSGIIISFGACNITSAVPVIPSPFLSSVLSCAFSPEELQGLKSPRRAGLRQNPLVAGIKRSRAVETVVDPARATATSLRLPRDLESRRMGIISVGFGDSPLLSCLTVQNYHYSALQRTSNSSYYLL